MAGAYTIFGRTVQSHTLAIATLISVGAIGFGISNRKSSPAPNSQLPSNTTETKSVSQTGDSDDIDIEKIITQLMEEDDEIVK